MTRYREEAGRPCVDVKVPALDNLFDKRDPAPFRERDLDPGLREYLFESAEDLLSRGSPQLVFWVEKPCDPRTLEEPFRAYFTWELERLSRRRRREVQLGFLALLIAFALIAAVISVSQLVSWRLTGGVGAALKEALVISGWVLLWRPVELLVYDGLPWRRERRVLRSLLAAPIDVRVGGAAPP